MKDELHVLRLVDANGDWCELTIIIPVIGR
jgi:hypothetical protein